MKRHFTDTRNVQNAGLWVSAILAGLVAVGYAIAFRKVDHIFHQFFIEHSPFWSLLSTPLFFFISWLLVFKFAPEAAGSGIPQIMAANEMDYQGEGRQKIDKLLSLRTALIKTASSLLCLLGGGAIGREGPTLQISTSIFHFIGNQIRRFIPHTSEQTWVVAGAAAGLASAFNTPLGGIVYAIEELGVKHFHQVRTALLSAVIVSGLVAQWLLGSYLYLGFPTLQQFSLSFMGVAILLGALAGLMGGVFGHLLFALLSLRQKMRRTWQLSLITLSCGLIMAFFFLIDERSAGTGIELITGYLFNGDFASAQTITLRFFGTMISYLSGAAGGIFSPSLAIGASVGSWFAHSLGTEHPNLMTLLGMIGFLTGVTRTPFTAFILVLEMTDRHVAIFPMMIVSLVAQWAGTLVDSQSFYEHVKGNWVVSEPKAVTPHE